MSNIIAAPKTEAIGCSISRDLTSLAASLDARFLRVGSTLSIAIGMIDRIIGGLDGIVAALDEKAAGTSVANMRYVAERLNGLPVGQHERADRIGDVSSIARRLHHHVLEMHEMLRVLTIYGMNIRIAASGQSQFLDFVRTMETRPTFGERHLSDFTTRLTGLMDSIASVQQADRLLSRECAKVVPDVPTRLASDPGELSLHLSDINRLAVEVADIARSVHAKVAIVLGALQVGDITRQRLEHVVVALQIVETFIEQVGGVRDPAIVGHIDRLLAAQIDAALEDFVYETNVMQASLRGLRPDTLKLLDLIAQHGDGGSRGLLVRLDASICDVERVTTRLREVERRFVTMEGVIADTVGDLSHRLADLQGIRLDVQDIAISTRHLCRRHGTDGQAVSNVAMEVDDHTIRLGVATFNVAEAISKLDAMKASLKDDSGMDARGDVSETLAEALSIIRQACRRTEAAMSEGSDNAYQLIDLLTHAGDDLGQEEAFEKAMIAASRRLQQGTPEAPVTAASCGALNMLLPMIANLYSMARERDVHARFLLLGMEPMRTEPDLENADDGLF